MGAIVDQRGSPQVKNRKKIFKMTYLGVILCEKLIARIPEAWKPLFDP
jgi:hypothetical protein